MLRKFFSLQFHRVVLIGLSILIQLSVLLVMLLRFQNLFAYFYAFSILLSLAVVVFIINSRSNPAYKLAWVVPILIFPFFGGTFYLLFGNLRPTKHEVKKMSEIALRLSEEVKPEQCENAVLEKLSGEDTIGGSQSRYIARYAHSPLYNNTITQYLPTGEVKFERMLEELRRAEHFIFLEYFIIQQGRMWDSILDILKEKASQGVDVRVIYDDLGCMMTLPYRYDRQLESMGIRCAVFNRFVPILSLRFNNRDHRKICVIDGGIGFTGGINLADEYINAYEKHGHWKDTAVIMQGDAVWNLTTMFLSMWDYLKDEREDYSRFKPDVYRPLPEKSDGYVQPFSDTPLDSECVGETVYLNMLNKAKRYVYITTPYLIIDNEMVTALTIAAKNGVDVRIITPHIADKWYVHTVTRSYYETLVESGVRIYEYTPGFIHAKTYVSDDRYAVVGTINMDYRSLYLHFECGTWMCGSSCVEQVRDDFIATLKICGEVTLEQCRSVKLPVRVCRALLRTFAPLM